MKNLINYYFGFNIDNIRMLNSDYYFLYNGIQYIFSHVDINKCNMDDIFKMSMALRNYSKVFHEIILNKDNGITTMVGSDYYVLLKVNIYQNKKISLEDIVNQRVFVKLDTRLLRNNNQFDWVDLWQNKIDYFEYYTNSMDVSNPFLSELINYYVGLGETAISYVKDTLSKFNSVVDNLVISHKRMDVDYTLLDLYNPLNITIDHVTRDIAEYFKGCFIKKRYDLSEFEKRMNMFYFNELEYRLLFGRMLFPSFFFDNYELYVDGQIEEKELLDIVNRIEEYEQFLRDIYMFISSRVPIPRINWLKKVDV